MNTLQNLINEHSLKKRENKEGYIFSLHCIISHVLQIPRLEFHLYLDKKLKKEEVEVINSLLKRKMNNEPLDYILGERDFYNVKLDIDPSVLIPRNETEQLVDLIEKRLTNVENKVLVDLCCGSGCIGISLKKKIPSIKVIGVDISDKALDIAKKNAKKNNVDVTFILGDFLTPLNGMKVDFVVCNPPYISKEEYLSLPPDVKNFEPKIALLADRDGLEYYLRLNEGLNLILNKGAEVFLEIGYKQGKRIKEIFSNEKYKDVEIVKDYYGNDRFCFLKNI
jgi:release factor glutamine methyltransferase